MNRPPWRVRKSWASSPGHRLITVFRWDDAYHGDGGYAAVKSFPTYAAAAEFIRAAESETL